MATTVPTIKHLAAWQLPGMQVVGAIGKSGLQIIAALGHPVSYRPCAPCARERHRHVIASVR